MLNLVQARDVNQPQHSNTEAWRQTSSCSIQHNRIAPLVSNYTQTPDVVRPLHHCGSDTASECLIQRKHAMWLHPHPLRRQFPRFVYLNGPKTPKEARKCGDYAAVKVQSQPEWVWTNADRPAPRPVAVES